MKLVQMLANVPQDVKDKITGGLPGGTDTTVVQTNIVNFILYVVGILAVVMVIVAGVQMTTSAGDPGAVKKAKMTMMYAIVGLVIAVLAYAIVNFVIGRL